MQRPRDKSKISAIPVFKLQLLIALGVCLIIWVATQNRRDFISALVGGIIAIVPTYVYIKIAFKNKYLVGYPGQVLRQHKAAMVAKFVVSLVLFALCAIIFRSCNFLLLFATYICVVIGGYFLGLIAYK